MSKYNKKGVSCYKDGIHQNTYDSITEASKDGFSRTCIQVALSKNHLYRGLKWILNEDKDTNEISITNPILDEIAAKYTPEELKNIAKGHGISEQNINFPIIKFDGDEYKMLFITDTHIGSKFFNPKYLVEAFKIAEKEKVNSIVHAGDVTEGMKNSRLGFVYECTHLGFESQREYAIDLLKNAPANLYMIDGNHDRFFAKDNQALMVKDICNMLDNATFLGHDEGDFFVNNIKIRLFHGEDGNSYATSYRGQKIIEAITGGDKPNILLLGHVHKQYYIFERHIHCVSGGSIQLQTDWMRGKRLAAHTGFHIISFHYNDSGVTRFKVEWYPFYA
jgi:predicted phosphodiesterase